MIQTVVTFFGPGKKDGMPVPFYCYWIIENKAPWLGRDKYVATIMPINDGPLPTQRHYIREGINRALYLAMDELNKQPELRGLKFFTSD
jgi:hypothetical protein